MTGEKILMTLMGLEIGGAETHVLELCKALTKRGLRVYVASNGGAYEPDLKALGIVHYKVPLNNRRLHNIVYAYFALRRIIRENGIRLVHAHGRIPGFLCGLLQRKLGFRFVTTAHGVYSTEFPLNVLSNWGEKSLVVSPDVRAYLIGSYRVPPENISVTVNGVDTDMFAPGTNFAALHDEFTMGDGMTRIVSLSRLDEDSAAAAQLLIRSAAAVYAAYPSVAMYVVGKGTLYEALQTEAEAVNEAARTAGRIGPPLITMTGGRMDACAWMAAADVFIGSGRSALEAFSAGTPVLMAGNAGYLGLLDEKTLPVALETNFMYRGCGAATVEKVTDGLCALLAMSPEARAAMGQMGRDAVNANYSVGRMADDALAVYASVLESPLPMRGFGTDVMISGYYGYNNSGDDLLLQSIIDSLQERKTGIRFTVLSMKPKETRTQYGVDAVYRFNFPLVFWRLRRTKLLITGGGSLLQDKTSTQSLIYYLWVINMAHRLGVRNMLYANGIGPVLKPANVKRVQRTLQRVELITLRDDESLPMLREIGVTAPEVHVTADAAFALPAADEQSARVYLDALGVTGPFFCVALRDWKYNPPGLDRVVAAFADYTVERYGYRAVFIPMRPSEDIEISRRVIALMKHPAVLAVAPSEDMHGIRGAVGYAAFVLGMRLHALIYAVEKAVPVIGLVYDPKIQRLMDSMKQRFYMPVEEADTGTLIRFLDAINAERDEITAEIGEAGHEMRAKAAQNAALCMELLDR